MFSISQEPCSPNNWRANECFRTKKTKIKPHFQERLLPVREGLFIKQKRFKIFALCFLAIGFVSLAVFSLLQITSIVFTYREGERTYQALTQLAISQSPQSSNTQTCFPEVDFDALRAINPNIVAWLILENTNISYPVVKGKDNIFYLNHMFDGAPNSVGALFVDSSNSPGFKDLKGGFPKPGADLISQALWKLVHATGWLRYLPVLMLLKMRDMW